MTTEERSKIEQMLGQADLQLTASELFLGLWASAQEHDDYDKETWCMLQTALIRLGVKV